MATHSSTLAWKIPWTEKPGRLQSMGSHRAGHDWSDLALAILEKCIFLQFRKLKSKIMVPSGLVSGGSSLPGLKMVAFSLCVHLIFPLCSCTETERVLWGVSSSSYKDINLIRIALTFMTSLNLNYLLKALSPNSATLEIKASAYELKEF